MIYDRPYMRSDYGRREMPVLAWIIGITVVVFIVQMLIARMLGSTAYSIFMDHFALSVPSLREGMLWTLFTYGFLHAGILHILGNLLMIYFIGRELVPILGPVRFSGLYAGSLIISGAAWTLEAVLRHNGGIVIGASGAAFALLTVFACFYPDRPITLLLFFILPVTVRPRYLAYFLLAISAFFVAFPSGDPLQVAHSAHLGGMAAGWIYFRYLHDRTTRFATVKPHIEMPKWFRKKKKTTPVAHYQVNITRHDDIRAEVDRILDKINANGFGALTESERKLLDEARDMLNKR